jgi:hypothetical protein
MSETAFCLFLFQDNRSPNGIPTKIPKTKCWDRLFIFPETDFEFSGNDVLII